MKIDPESAKKIHPHNVRRVIRALEVYHCTGKTMTELQKTQQPELLYDAAIDWLNDGTRKTIWTN